MDLGVDKKNEFEYLILVVVYNIKLSHSETIQSLIHSKEELSGSKLVIWDNSSAVQEDSQIAWVKNNLNNLEVCYIHTPKNMPLSKIYNSIRSDFQGITKFIVLLDQDSKFCSNFFIQHKILIKQGEISNLYLPIIKFKNTIISPAWLFYFKGFRYKTPFLGRVSSLFKTAINSGMIIDFHYFQNIFEGYDERLNFYGTDDYFMQKYQLHNTHFVILNYEFEHNLTYSFLNPNIAEVIKRYHDANKAILINNEHSTVILLLAKIFLKLRGFYLYLKFRNRKFLQ